MSLRQTMFALAVCLVGCGQPLPDEEAALELGSSAEGLTLTAAGRVPTGLPQRLMVGLKEEKGKTWMKNSGVPWDARYQYLTLGWANNWGYGANDGAYAFNFFKEAEAASMVPAVVFYEMNDHPGGGEDQFLAKVKTASTMKAYFSNFKVLMQRAKDFGKPVVVLVEPDGFGLLEQQTQENAQVSAAIASTGMPELAGLPNTVAGWGMAFLKLRDAVGASNAVLGIHVSGWASGKDLFHYSVTDSLQPEVDKVYRFLSPLGLAANATGKTYDLLVGDPLDRDADYYRLARGSSSQWWDPSDTASVYSRSFNRYAEWLRMWNVKASKRWVLWQLPLGNSNHRNVANDGTARAGYKDNRAEYFFGQTSYRHLETWAQKGVIALLFGAGATGQSLYTNDTWTDGQLFMKSRAGAFLRAGGLPFTPPAPPPPPPPDAGTPTADTAQYNFEAGAQGWTRTGGLSTVASSTSRAYAGTHSLAVNFTAPAAGTEDVFVRLPATPATATVTYRVFCPTGAKVTGAQAYVLQGAGGGWKWTGVTRSGSAWVLGAWNTFSVALPAGAVTPLDQLGVEFTVSGAWTGSCAIDSVRW